MAIQDLIILSYHQFFSSENTYPFSRTYKQFQNDLDIKDFDWITMDDGHIGIIKACKMMQEKNFRAKIFISTALIGTKGYCTWEDIWLLSRFHDIENHSHNHVHLKDLDHEEINNEISTANYFIHVHTGRWPRYLVAPWNELTEGILKVAENYGLQIIKDRTDIKNDSR